MAKSPLIKGQEDDGGPVFVNDENQLLMNSLNSDSASDTDAPMEPLVLRSSGGPQDCSGREVVRLRVDLDNRGGDARTHRDGRCFCPLCDKGCYGKRSLCSHFSA